jgi:hypothetical protein
MNIENFIEEFDQVFPEYERFTPSVEGYLDPVPEIAGVCAPKLLWLLNLAYSFLAPNEAYLEIGAHHGKGLISAIRYNDERPIYVCDDFSCKPEACVEFSKNMRRARLTDRIVYFNSDPLNILNKRSIPHKVGACFVNDTIHPLSAIEPVLAKESLVIVGKDDIPRPAAGWELLYNLPSMRPHDPLTWWDGASVFSFKQP